MIGCLGNNIWCISLMFDFNKLIILLNFYIDIVKLVNGWWKYFFILKVENGKIYGLGSNDVGVSVVFLF